MVCLIRNQGTRYLLRMYEEGRLGRPANQASFHNHLNTRKGKSPGSLPLSSYSWPLASWRRFTPTTPGLPSWTNPPLPYPSYQEETASFPSKWYVTGAVLRSKTAWELISIPYCSRASLGRTLSSHHLCFHAVHAQSGKSLPASANTDDLISGEPAPLQQAISFIACTPRYYQDGRRAGSPAERVQSG